MVSTTYVQFLKGMLLVFFSGRVDGDDPVAGSRGHHRSRQPRTQTLRVVDGRKIVNGLPQGRGAGEGDFRPIGHVKSLPGGVASTGPLGPIGFLSTLRGSEVILWGKKTRSSMA